MATTHRRLGIKPSRRRGMAALAAGVIVSAVALVVAPTTSASAQPALKTGIFDPAEVGWVSVSDLTEAQFSTAFTKWSDKHFLVTDIEADMTPNGLRLGAVWQYNTDGRGWMVKTRMTLAQYQQIAATAFRDGLRLHDMETYVRDGTRYYAAAWVQNVEGLGTDAQHNLTYDEAVTYFTQQRERRLPVDVDAYPTSAGVRYALIWLDNPTHITWNLHLSLTSPEFATAFASYDPAFRMLVVDSVQGGHDQRYAGIWLANSNGRDTVERRGLTAHEYANWWHRYADLGYREVSYERYDTAGGPRYVTVWRQNSDRPVWSLREDVDERVQQELDDWDVPGISVAVMKDGESVYLRGFGDADVAADRWMTSSDVMRWASVSKPLAGALTMRLYELGEITSVYDASDTYLPLLPAHQTHTIEQLASNRGCVRHYADADTDPEQAAVDDLLQSTQYGNALEPAQLMWDDPLVCTPGTYFYTTFGYLILGAVLEAAVGLVLPDLIREVMLEPFDLGTVAPEDLTDITVQRAKIYDEDNDEVEPDNNTWCMLGAGMESSVADLARFGHKLQSGQIISPLAVEYLWSGTPWSYSYGWNLDTEDDIGGNPHRVVTKTGGQLGSDAYIQMYPDDGIVIALLSNRRGAHGDVPGHDTADVGAYIGTLMINS